MEYCLSSILMQPSLFMGDACVALNGCLRVEAFPWLGMLVWVSLPLLMVKMLRKEVMESEGFKATKTKVVGLESRCGCEKTNIHGMTKVVYHLGIAKGKEVVGAESLG
ncbi:hypothetical protein L1887_37532 [Cichorium endivia]|nr:hypothetical protein L1887_37532 [Cichorium endivia]